MKNSISYIVVTVFLLSTIACMNHSKEGGMAAIDATNMDTTKSPKENFYYYVNGGWTKKNPIPSSESAWNSFKEIEENNHKILKEVLEAAATDTKAEKGSN